MDHNSRKPTLKLHNPYPKRKDLGKFQLSCIKLIMYASINGPCDLELATVKYQKGIAENVLVGNWRNQGDDLMPTIEEGEVIKEFRTRDDELNVGIDDYPSYCDYDKKIHIDLLENMDDYRDEGMGDVIFGEPFLREVG
ncbi:hypothetical protein Tco_1438934 [Tanacetum coccineum]